MQKLLETGLGPNTDNIINHFLNIILSPNFRQEITDKLINPITDEIKKKVRPYRNMVIGMYLLMRSKKHERFVKRTAGALLFPRPFGYDEHGIESAVDR